MELFSRVACLVCLVGIQANASVVYEGFDYTLDTNIAGKGVVGNGWSGGWVTANPIDNAAELPHTVAAGQPFGSLPMTGNALHRASRAGSHEISRTITRASQGVLTADHSTIWFSVLMAPRIEGNTSGFSNNCYGSLVLGNARFVDGTGAAGLSAPEINDGGSAVGVGFAGNGPSFDDMRIQGVVYNHGMVAQSKATGATLICGDRVSMIVGKIVWASDGGSDILCLYEITDPDAALPAPFCTMKADLDQSSFNVVAIGQGQCEFFDEIRFGTTYSSVFPQQASLGLLFATTGFDRDESAGTIL